MAGNSEAALLLLNDGRAGHWRQVRALAERLGGPSIEIPVRLRQPWRALAPHRFPLGLAAHPEIRSALPAEPPAAVLSCGRRSALVLRWLKRRWPDDPPLTVQILDCGLDPRTFDWVVTPRHDGLSGPNVIRTLGSLNPVDDAWLAAAQYPAPVPAPAPSLVVLLGGPTRACVWNRRWWREWLGRITAVAEKAYGSVTVVGSPRTPAWVAEEAHSQQSGVRCQSIPWPAAGDTDEAYRAMLAAATHLVVSADSVNLLSEASATGKPVFVIGAERARGRARAFVDALIGGAYAVDASMLADALRSGRRTRVLRETGAVAVRLRQSGRFQADPQRPDRTAVQTAP